VNRFEGIVGYYDSNYGIMHIYNIVNISNYFDISNTYRYNINLNGIDGQKGDTEPHGAIGSKTFVREHPLNKDKYLVHACLEGPEAGVYYRGERLITHSFT